MASGDLVELFSGHVLAPLGIPLSYANKVILERDTFGRGVKCHVKLGSSEPISHFSPWNETLDPRDSVRQMHENLVRGVKSKLIDQGHVYPFLLAGCV